jgi:chromosome partitioning protein
MTINYRALGRVVCIANGKGGVVKTSLAANLAGLAAAAKYRTLIVDLDPQGDLSDDLGYFDHDGDDHGRGLASAMVAGHQLVPTLRDVRPGLDVVTGGLHLADVSGALAARASRGDSTTDLLARALAPLASSYDLVVVDTPPVDTTLQALALNASRWLLIPTKADASSIRGIQRIAERVADARQAGHEIDILGVVLAGVPTAARRVRAGAIADITAVLGDSASLLDAVVRSSDAVARECRTKGILAHELAEELEGAEPFWRALRNGSTPQQRVPGSAPALADDYIRVTEQVLLRLSDLEAAEGAA